MKRLIRGGSLWLFVIVAVAGSGNQALGYSTDTHKVINEAIFNYSGLVGYFDNALQISITGSQTFQGKTGLKLFRDAGVDEDSPPLYLRGWSHYHDPIKVWGQAGYPGGLSSVLWAQYNRIPSSPPLISGPNDWAWDNANLFFLGGLTATDNATRDQNQANLFSTLGRLSHLVADMSVPEHSRNDAHVLRNYESWCKEKLTRLTSTAMGLEAFRYEFTPAPVIFALYQPRIDPGNVPLSPVSNLWDTTVTAGYNLRLFDNSAPVGLAEYSNFNYFSNDTVFDNTNYQHPSRAESWLDTVVAKDGKIDRVIYFKRLASDGVLVSHLAAAKLLYQDWQTLTEEQRAAAKFTVAAKLDDKCYEDYASNLVPRAVSYGTALVNYFFRGKFGVTTQGNTLTVQNLSSGDVDGSITIYAEDAAGTRTAVPGFVDRPLVSLAPNGTMPFGGFSPTGSRDDRYTMVFKGQMRNAGTGGTPNWDNVVAGKVFPWTPTSLPDKITVGANPHGLAFTPDGRKVYVTNTSSDSVSVIDTATRQVIQTISVGSRPVDVAVSPNAPRAFVSNEGGRSVSVIDTRTDQVEATIAGLPPSPEEIAVTPDGGSVYLAHWSYTALTKIDAGTLSAASYTTPQRPCQGIALHPGSSAAYLTYYTFYWGNAVAVVDRSSQTLTSAIPGPDLNWSAALGNGNQSLYVANPQLNTVSVYDTRTNQFIRTVTVGGSPRGIAANPGGTRVYVANLLDDNVSVIDTATNTALAPLAAGDGAYDVAVSPDGRLLYVTNAFEGTVSVLPADGSSSAQAGSFARAMTAAAPEEATWGTVVLTGFPPGGRVSVDGEFPRWEGNVEGGTAVSFPAGARTLYLICPGFLERAFPVSAGPGETVSVDGQMMPE